MNHPLRTSWRRQPFGRLKSRGQRFHAVRRLELRAIESLLAPVAGERILDVGCGKGFFCRRLRDFGSYPWGLDPQVSSLTFTRSHQSLRLPLQAGIGECLPYRDQSFQKVVSVCVLEHTTDDDAALREVRRVLEPGGTFVCSVDALNSPFLGERYRRDHAARFRCNRFYTEQSLRAKLAGAGFGVRSVTGLFSSRPAQTLLKLGGRFRFGAPFVAMFPLIFPILAADRAFGQHPGQEFILVASAFRP